MAAADASAQEAQQMPFIKNLASSDRKLRTESLSSLQAFLSSRRSLTSLDARKLWTGLYYALWMTDRPRPQQQLAADLAALLFGLQPACVGPWLEGFWAVLSAQWPHIEALRLDKFLLLVRRVFAAQVRWVKQQQQEAAHNDGGGGAAEVVLAVLGTWCFDAEDREKVALGLRLHILDVWVDELEREGAIPAGGEAGEEEEVDQDAKAKAFVEKIGVMVDALKRCPVKSVRQRAQESYDDERLPWAVVASDAAMDEDGGADEEEEDDDEWGGIDD